MQSAFQRNLLTSGWKVWNCEYHKKRRRLKNLWRFYVTSFALADWIRQSVYKRHWIFHKFSDSIPNFVETSNKV